MSNEHVNRKLRVCFSVLLITIMCISQSFAISYAKFYTLQELCEGSSDIIVARVQSKESYWGKDKKRMYTDVSFVVEECMKGNLQSWSNIKITLFGGQVDDIAMFIVGGPQFSKGERTLLFLNEIEDEKTQENNYSITGLSQGKFEIFMDEKTHEEKIERMQLKTPLKLDKNGRELPMMKSNAANSSVVKNHINNFVR